MKKEFSTLIQFIIIAGVSAVFFYLVLPIKYPQLSVEALEIEISQARYWIYSFIGLSAIRFVVFSVIFRKTAVETNQSLLKVLFQEVSKTSQYFIIAIISVFFAFWFFLSSLFKGGGGFSFDLYSIWLGTRHESFLWLSAFSVLSLLRLGIICVWKVFLGKSLEITS